ncbi:MAG: DUF4062 domain-containing protein [Candidatus Aminicenantes bacterium]|nr:DUF4062 domain-containing protein [Candidatus Aminicenantes bacterium]
MAKQETILKVLIASPGDVKPERNAILDIIEEMNIIWSKAKNIRIVPITWEKDSYPDIGEYPQDVVNKQLLHDYDFFIGILWSWFGTPTKKARSGTEEEFNQAYAIYQKKPKSIKIMFYFKNKPIAPDDIEPKQIELIKNFKDKIKAKNLYQEFRDTEEFKTLIRRHLEQHLIDWGITWGIPIENKVICQGDVSGKDSEKQIYFSEEDGFFDIYEKSMSESQKIKLSALKINEALADYVSTQEKIHNRSNNTDPKNKNIKESVNQTANNMDKLRNVIEKELPLLQESSKIYLDGLRHAAIFINELNVPKTKPIEQSLGLISNTKSSFNFLIPKIDSIIEVYSKYRRLTTKFNKSKKEFLSTFTKFRDTMKNIVDTSTIIEGDMLKLV